MAHVVAHGEARSARVRVGGFSERASKLAELLLNDHSQLFSQPYAPQKLLACQASAISQQHWPPSALT